MDDDAARLDRAFKMYGNHAALRGVSLHVARGETLALLGPNGAGKTTAIRCLLGLIRPTAGTATIFGADPAVPRHRARIGAMLQVGSVPGTLTVREHVASFSAAYPHPLPLDETLSIAGLEALAKRRFAHLSGGERQRLFFALAICGDPDLLVLDEPTAGLDPASRRALWKRVREFVARGRSVLLTTHYLEEADALSDRVVVIDRGRIVVEGTAAAIKSQMQAASLEDAFLDILSLRAAEAV